MFLEKLQSPLIVLQTKLSPCNSPMGIRDMFPIGKLIYKLLVVVDGLIKIPLDQIVVANTKVGFFQPAGARKKGFHFLDVAFELGVILKLSIAFSYSKNCLGCHVRRGGIQSSKGLDRIKKPSGSELRHPLPELILCSQGSRGIQCSQLL